MLGFVIIILILFVIGIGFIDNLFFKFYFMEWLLFVVIGLIVGYIGYYLIKKKY